MAVRRPLRINGTQGLIEMTDTEMAYMRYRIRTNFALNEMAGWLRINSTPAGWVSRGSATDQSRSVGRTTVTQPGGSAGWGSTQVAAVPGTLGATTYTISQNGNRPTEATLLALADGPLVANAGDFSDLAPMNTGGVQDVYDTVIDQTIQDIEGGGNGIFNLGTSVPAGYVSTGYTMANRQVTPGSTGGPGTTTFTLSINRGEAAPTVVRPVRYDSGGGVIEMTDGEIEAWGVQFLAGRYSDGNRLVYNFATTAAGINCGQFADTIYTGTTGNTLLSGATYYRDVQSLSTTTTLLRLADT